MLLFWGPFVLCAVCLRLPGVLGCVSYMCDLVVLNVGCCVFVFVVVLYVLVVLIC